MSVTSTAATSVTLVSSSTSFTAGGAALTLTATVAPVQQSVPLAFSTAAGTGGAGTLSTNSGTTDSTGKVTVTLSPSNTLGTGTASAKLALAAPVTSTVTITTSAGVPSTVAFTTNLKFSTSKFYNTTANAIPTFDTVKYATVPDGLEGVTASATDAFGNTITWSAAPKCTFLAFGGLFDTGASTSSASDNSTVVPADCTTTTATTDKGYFQSSAYGTSGYLQASISGKYLGTQYTVSGLTRNILTSVFDSAANTPTFTVTSPQKAGASITVTYALTTAQSGVKVQLLALNSTKPYNGFFVAGNGPPTKTNPANVTATTDSTGKAVATFSLATNKSQSVTFKAQFTRLTNTAPYKFTIGPGSATAAIATIAGNVAQFVVKAAFDSPLTLTTTKVAPTGTLYVDVGVADQYGNIPTSCTTQPQIQITLNNGGLGTLSASTVFIPSGVCRTSSAGGFGPITWTFPSGTVVGSSAALTASGLYSGSTSMTVVSASPTLTVTLPKKAGDGNSYSSVSGVGFTGSAAPSAGLPPATALSKVFFSVDTGAQTLASGTTGWTFITTLTAGKHTVNIFVNDTLHNVSPATTYTVIVDTTAPTITFTTATGSKLTTGTVTATITDAQGTLNATLVTASYNSTSVAASSISVVGTNNPGTSVTYTVTISGIPNGHWTVTLNAKDLAGNVAAATSISVTITLQTDKSFTNPVSTPPTSCTSLGYTGVCSSWTNNLPTTQTVNVWAVAYNSKNQVLFATFSQLTFTVGGSNTVFVALSSTLPSGTYTVQVFVITTTGVSVSPAGISATVTV